MEGWLTGRIWNITNLIACLIVVTAGAAAADTAYDKKRKKGMGKISFARSYQHPKFSSWLFFFLLIFL